MALADDIKARLDEIKARGAVQPDRQAQAQAVLQTKATGKIAPLAPAPLSSEGQAGALAAGAAAMEQQNLNEQVQTSSIAGQQQGLLQRLDSAKQGLASTGRMQTAALQSGALKGATTRQATGEEFSAKLAAQQEQQMSNLTHQFGKNLKQLAADKQVAESDILSSFKHDSRDLAFRKDAAELEQVAFSLAMQDKQYMQTLNASAAIQNLQDNAKFREESTRLILGEELKSVIDQMDFNKKFAYDEVRFQEEMSKISLDEALNMANASIRQANTQAVISGVTKVASTAASYDYGSSESELKMGQTETISDNGTSDGYANQTEFIA